MSREDSKEFMLHELEHDEKWQFWLVVLRVVTHAKLRILSNSVGAAADEAAG